MKKIFTFVLIVCTIQNMFAQAVGYQGKKFTIEVGYSPVTTLTARYFDFNLSDTTFHKCANLRLLSNRYYAGIKI